MTDKFSSNERSAVMAKVKGKNTKPEIALRKELFSLGLRYRLHSKILPGKPDIIFPKYESIIFVHGCFWHSHGCRKNLTPQSNVEYWTKKISNNLRRDRKNIFLLKKMGWKVLVVWECTLTPKKLPQTLKRVFNWLIRNSPKS